MVDVSMDKDSSFDCELCPNVLRIGKSCHMPLREERTKREDTRRAAEPSGCPVSQITARSVAASRVAAMLEVGALNVEQVDAWYLEAAECVRAERSRHMRASLETG